jgi:hypothetical protein
VTKKIAIACLLIVSVVLVVILFRNISQKLPSFPMPIPTQPSKSSTLSEYLKIANRHSKPATGELSGGIIPEPPRKFVKESEKFAKKWVKEPTRVTYNFFDHAASPESSSSLTVYISPDPFRWRVDYDINTKKGKYKIIYLFDGKGYSSCNIDENASKNCYQASSQFLEKEFQPPIPLVQFLNDTLDTKTLKDLVPIISSLEQNKSQAKKMVFAGKNARCLSVKNELRALELCIAEEGNMLLYLDVVSFSTKGKKLSQLTLTASDIDLSPNFEGIFSLSSL